MPSLLDLRRRIRAVKSTQQITKAMKMISASKLRRAQDRIVGARPFARQMQRVLNGVASGVDPAMHPLLAEREINAGATVLAMVVTADKGLCGGFNTNVIKAAGAFIASHGAGAPGGGPKVALGLVGRKGRDFFRRRGFEVRFEEVGIFQRVQYTDAQRIAQAAIDAFLGGQVVSVSVVYNEFKSVMQQRVVTEQLLPIPKLDAGSRVQDRAYGFDAGSRVRDPAYGPRVPQGGQTPYLFEPGPAQILTELLPKHVEIQLYRILLESAAAEHAARMTAMDAASKNSGEIIDNLTLYMNKVRQAAITREIIEVVSGAQAL